MASVTRFRLLCLLAMVAALALGVPANAGASGQAKQGSAPSGKQARSGLHGKVVGGLPFTGLDVIALAAVAVALTSTGLALRRLTIRDGEPA
jgi:hypothetical protein